MALREFVSNAIDCSVIMGTEPAVTPEVKRRAKAGHTRIFVSMNDKDVAKFYNELDKHFLHFSINKNDGDFLNKNPETNGPRVYRCRVLVNELQGADRAVFDYNFKADEIEIDECRNSSPYSLRGAIAQKINKAPVWALKKLFEALSQGKTYEGTLDDFYLHYYVNDKIKKNWVDAWKAFAGDAVLATPEMAASPLAQHVAAKGHKIMVLHSAAFCKTCVKMGVPSVSSVLGKAAASGRVEVPTTEAASAAVSEVWGWMEGYGMTQGKPVPAVKSFKEMMEGERSVMGFYEHGTQEVNIREDLDGKYALKVALEECAHYVSGAGDCSRDFQQYFIDMLVEALN